MNDTFSLQRLGLLIRKFTKEHIYTYLLYAACAFGIVFVIYGLMVASALDGGRFKPEVPTVLYTLGLVFGGGLFSASFYSFFHNKAKGIQFLNLPSSSLEKLVLGFLFTQVVFFTSFIGIFWLTDQAMVSFYNHFRQLPQHMAAVNAPMYVAEPMDFTHPLAKGSVIFSLTISAITHFGSLRFEKSAFVKTALFIIIAGTILYGYNYYAMKSMIPEEVMPGGRFYNEKLRIGNDPEIKGVVSLPESWDHFIYWLLPVMLYVLFWTGSYFKLKEKQV